LAQRDSAAVRALLGDLVAWTRSLMHDGAPFAMALRGRVGWELRLVVQGGLRILEKIGRHHNDCLNQRPLVRAIDAPLLIWRSLTMRADMGLVTPNVA